MDQTFGNQGQFSAADISNFIAQNASNPQAIADAAAQFGISASDIQAASGYTPAQQASFFQAANITPTYAGLNFLPTTTAETTTAADTTAADTTTQTGGLPTTTQTGVTPTTNQNALSGVILAGDSWIANNDPLQKAFSGATSQPVTNAGVGGATSSDTLNQLNSFLSGGGAFAPGSTVVLNIGGNDFLSGIDRNVTRNNLDEILSTLDKSGVKVILSGAPNVSATSDITSNQLLTMDPLYQQLADKYSNVSLVNSMPSILSQPNLRTSDVIHATPEGQTQFANALVGAYKNLTSPEITDSVIKDFITENQNNPAAIANAISQFDVSASDIQRATGLTPEQQASYFISKGMTPRYAGLDVAQQAISDRSGNIYDKNTILTLASQIIPNIGELKGGIFGTKGESVGFGYDEATRLLGRAPNPGEQVVLDMARNLASKGITDLSQLQLRDITQDITARPIYSDEYGVPTGRYQVTINDPATESAKTIELTAEQIANLKERQVDTGEGVTTEKYAPKFTVGKGLYAANNLLSETYGGLDSLRYNLGETYSGPGMTGYQIVINPTTGKPQFTTYGSDTGEGQLISNALTIASFIPGVAPFAQAANALWAASQGNYAGALASFASLGGYQNLSTALRVADAIDKKDPFTLVTSLMSNPNISPNVGSTKLAGDVTISDVGNAVKLVTALNSDNPFSALSAAVNLTKSIDAKTAAAGTKIADALNSGDYQAAALAAKDLETTLAAADKITSENTIKNIASSVIESSVIESGYPDVQTAVYENAINSGASQSIAQNAADTVGSVIQYPGGETPNIESTQVAKTETPTKIDVTGVLPTVYVGDKVTINAAGMMFDKASGAFIKELSPTEASNYGLKETGSNLISGSSLYAPTDVKAEAGVTSVSEGGPETVATGTTTAAGEGVSEMPSQETAGAISGTEGFADVSDEVYQGADTTVPIQPDLIPVNLQGGVSAGTITQNSDGSFTERFDDGSTIEYDNAGTITDVTTSTDTGTTGVGTTVTEEAGAGEGEEAGTGDGGGGGGGTGEGAGTGTEGGTGAGGTGTGGTGGTGGGGGGGGGTPTLPTPRPQAPALISMLNMPAAEFLKPRELPMAPDIKLVTALEEITGGLTSGLNPSQLAATEIKFFDYFDEKEKERERQKEEEEANRYYYDVDVQEAKEGGLIDHKPEFYSEGGASVMANRYVKGRGDGTSDSVPAMLASGEFVIPADVVSSLGNGDNDAGAKTLDKFMEVIRVHKRNAPPNKLPEDSKGPLAYLEEALTKVRKKNQNGRTK